jgi:hypothetical protein
VICLRFRRPPKKDDQFFNKKLHGWIFKINLAKVTIQIQKSHFKCIFTFSASLLRKKTKVLNTNFLIKLVFTKLNIKVKKQHIKPPF